ncbi:hypothetical protein AMTRI_Chr08g163010 [Amborella trichopoda]
MAKVVMVLHYLFVVALLLRVSEAHARSFKGFERLASQTLDCDQVFGVRQNDTCFSVTQLFNLTKTAFDGLNPNLNCDKLFVGQWLCIKESVLYCASI